MTQINYIKGDATDPKDSKNKIIVHICNDIGGWGKGFVMALSKKWQEPEINYRKWHASNDKFELGKVQFVQVEEDLWIANLIGQHKTRYSKDGNPPIRYEAVEEGLNAVATKAKELSANIHMPRIGCGLAGGKWEVVEHIISKTLSNNNIEVTVYDFG